MSSGGSLIVPASKSGAPEDEIQGTVCPVRSSVSIYKGPSEPMAKVGMDVGCRRSCMWFMPLTVTERVDGKSVQVEKPRCAVLALAAAMEERA